MYNQKGITRLSLIIVVIMLVIVLFCVIFGKREDNFQKEANIVSGYDENSAFDEITDMPANVEVVKRKRPTATIQEQANRIEVQEATSSIIEAVSDK